MRKYGSRIAPRINSIDSRTLENLTRNPWPGNIRELENIVARTLILSTTPVPRFDPDTVGLPACPPIPAPMRIEVCEAVYGELSESGRLSTVQRVHISNTLRDANWVIAGRQGAALRLGVKPATLRHRMKKLGISRTIQ